VDASSRRKQAKAQKLNQKRLEEQMTDATKPEDTQVIKDSIQWLRSKAQQGELPLEQLADMVGVSAEALERWMVGESDPTENRPRRRLVWLYHQSKNWYLRVCPFMVAIWSPSDQLVAQERQQGTLPISSFIRSVTFYPQTQYVLRCDIVLGGSFDSINFMVHSYYRGVVSISDQPTQGQGKLMANFRSGYHELYEGSTITMYLHYAV
jgi:hypothetical protein